MTDRIAVLPNKDSAIGMAHPIDGPLKKDGSLWLDDLFTARRLTDGSIIRTPEKIEGEGQVEGAEVKTPDAELNVEKAKVLPGLKTAAAEQKTGLPAST